MFKLSEIAAYLHRAHAGLRSTINGHRRPSTLSIVDNVASQGWRSWLVLIYQQLVNYEGQFLHCAKTTKAQCSFNCAGAGVFDVRWSLPTPFSLIRSDADAVGVRDAGCCRVRA
jgi:hypothetical protein